MPFWAFFCAWVCYITTTPEHPHTQLRRRSLRQCQNEVVKLSSLLRQCKSEVQKRSLARSAIVSTHYQGKSAAKRRDTQCRSPLYHKTERVSNLFFNKKGTFVAFTPFPTVYYNICSFSLMLGSLPVSPSGVATLRDKPVAGFKKLHY